MRGLYFKKTAHWSRSTCFFVKSTWVLPQPSNKNNFGINSGTTQKVLKGFVGWDPSESGQTPSIFWVRSQRPASSDWRGVSVSHTPLVVGGRCAKYKGGLFNATLEAGVGFQGKPWTKKTQFQNCWYIIFAYESRVVFLGELDYQIFGVLFRAPDWHWHNMSRKLSPLLVINRVILPF